ncbi:MAG: tRNA pseudouridine(13) synthase TruD [Planctomycetota bacterium]
MSGGIEVPFLTAHLPGTGGRLRECPEDFRVEEKPLYEPCGTGSHAYLQVEKVGLSTFEAIRRLARALGRAETEFGYAGIKDRHAQTVQLLSIEHPRCSLEELQALEIDGLRIRAAAWHRNKLRIGHLQGNTFSIRIAQVRPDALARARAILEVLEQRGLPNFFGPQRFGSHATTHLLGRALVRGSAAAFFDALLDPPPELLPAGKPLPAAPLYREGRYREAEELLPWSARCERQALRALMRTHGQPDRALRILDRRLLRFYVAAYQSCLFNSVLAQRLGELDGVRQGDVAYLHANGACFVVEDPSAERPRVEAFEISATGPLFGYRMLEARGEVGALEGEILREEGLGLESFRAQRMLAFKGGRRPLRVPLRSPEVVSEGEDLILRCFLPAGTYATVLLGELMKTEPLEGGEGTPSVLAIDDLTD